MEKEYRISIGTKILYSFFAIAVFSVSIFFLFLKNFLLIIPLLFLVGSILIIVNFMKRKIIVSDKSLLCINLFSQKEINITAIKGYRFNPKLILVEPISTLYPTINIGNYLDFQDHEGLREWFVSNFKDLDALDLEKEHDELLKNRSFGATEEERDAKLKTSKKIANFYNIISCLMGGIFLFLDNSLSFIVLIILPIIGILILYNFELIKFLSNSKRSIYGNITIGFMLPSIFLLINTTNYTLLVLDNIWLPTIVIICLVFTLLYYKGINKSVEQVKGQVILLLFVSIFYGFGSAKAINCGFDNSKQQLFCATILDHHINHGRHKSYYLKLSKWGPQDIEENENVSESRYENTQIGDTVVVQYKLGLFKAPWFIIIRKQ